MSETVVIALITFASGAFGALTGIIGGIVSANIAAKAQMKQTVIQEQFNVRVKAYQQVFSAHTTFSANENDPKRLEAFLTAIQQACVISSAPTSAALILWQETISPKVPSSVRKAAMTDALIAMQRDLDNFTEPKIRKNKWPKKPPMPQVPQT